MANFYTPEQIEKLQFAAYAYRLDFDSDFIAAEPEELAKICDGYGPERWSELKRKALTTVLKRYEVCFAIHDVGCFHKKRSRAFEECRLYRNMIRVWRKDFGLFRWFTHAGRAEFLVVIPLIYAAVISSCAYLWETKTGEKDE